MIALPHCPQVSSPVKGKLCLCLDLRGFAFRFNISCTASKGCGGKNWLKASFVILALVRHKAEIGAIGEHPVDGRFGKWRSVPSFNTKFRQKVGDSAEGVRPFGIFLKRFYHNARFGRMRFNISRFGIVHIAKGSAHQLLASTNFLADTTGNILNEVVAVILTLSERHLQHKFPLRSWLKPKCRKAQRNYFGRVYCVNDAPAVHAVCAQDGLDATRGCLRRPYFQCGSSFH